MSNAQSPDFSRPRSSGSRFAPDFTVRGASVKRGTYPADRGGPPQTKVTPTASGDAFSPDTPPNGQVERVAPRKPVSANTTTNPLK